MSDATTLIQWPLFQENLGKPAPQTGPWILMKQEMMGWQWHQLDQWTICKWFTPHPRQIAMPAPYHSGFNRPDAFPDAQPSVSKHWRQTVMNSLAKFKSLSQNYMKSKQVNVTIQTSMVKMSEEVCIVAVKVSSSSQEAVTNDESGSSTIKDQLQS